MSATSGVRHKIGTILVPTDFSAEADKALEYAKALRRESGATLHLVYVREIDYVYAMPTVMTAPPVQMTEDLDRAEKEELKKLAERCAAEGAPAQAHMKSGRAFDGICQTAAEIGANLIVISTHGHTGLKHLFLGSTTERVVQHSPCPVLVVREQERDFVQPGGSGGAPGEKPLRISKIVVPVDFSDCARHGLRYALDFAKAHGASVLLLHAVELVPFMPSDRFATWEHMPPADVLENAAREQMARFEQETDFGGVPHEAKVIIGRPADEICRTAEQWPADLIITSTHGHTGLAHVLIGSTAEHLVRYAHCPVLVVPQRKQQNATS